MDIDAIASRIASTCFQRLALNGAGAQLRVEQIKKILSLYGKSLKDFEKAPKTTRGLISIRTFTLPTKARIVFEKNIKGAYYLQVSPTDTPDYKDVFWKNVKEIGGLAGGYNIGRMV